MWLKFSAIFLVFCALAFLQHGFLGHVPLFGIVPDMVFIFFFITAFMEPSGHYRFGLFAVGLAGFFRGIFSPFPFSISLVVLLVLFALLKSVMQSIKQAQGTYLFGYFAFLFSIFFTGQLLVQNTIINLPYAGFPTLQAVVLSVIVNLGVALAILYAWTYLARQPRKKQLKLFR